MGWGGVSCCKVAATHNWNIINRTKHYLTLLWYTKHTFFILLFFFRENDCEATVESCEPIIFSQHCLFELS